VKKISILLFLRSRAFPLLTCFIILISLLLAISKPVLAQSPYNDALNQMRVVQQQLNELLASYQASEPEVRANMDAALAISVKQALQ
jgi:hypothetical protein